MVSKSSAVTNDPLVCFQATAISIDPKIPLDSVKALKTKDKGSEAYKSVMKETNGQDIEGAKKASWEATGGGLCEWWHNLCNAGHITCLVVRCPRCDYPVEMYTMQENLKMLIFRIDKRIAEQCIDIFTSSGPVGETISICMWPIYLGTAVKNLAAILDIAEVGVHKFKAWTTFEGRAKIRAKPVDLWHNVTIGGRPLAELTPDQLEQTIWNFCCSTAGTPNATAVFGQKAIAWTVQLGEETWTHIASFLSAGEALLVSSTTPMLRWSLDRPFLLDILLTQKVRRRHQLERARQEEEKRKQDEFFEWLHAWAEDQPHPDLY